MNFIKDIVKGMLIGIANIFPGVSGGTMAVSMGVYDKIILAITGIRKNFKKSVLTLLPYAVGALAGIGALSFVVKYAIGNYPLQTAGLFVGLIIGGVPMLYNKIKGKKIGTSSVLAFLFFFALVVGMAFMSGNEGTATDIAITPVTVLQLFLAGVVSSATMIIPGISGSLVMMILGFYNIIVSNISSFLTAIASMNMAGLLHGVGIFVPFGLGVLCGIGLVAKAIEYLFQKAPVLTYSAILGLIVGSPIAILYETGITALGLGAVLVTVLTFGVGFCAAYFLGKES